MSINEIIRTLSKWFDHFLSELESELAETRDALTELQKNERLPRWHDTERDDGQDRDDNDDDLLN